jgi:hypothetical protein
MNSILGTPVTWDMNSKREKKLISCIMYSMRCRCKDMAMETRYEQFVPSLPLAIEVFKLL